MAKTHCLIFQVTEFAYLSRPAGGHRIASYLRQAGWDAEVIDWANHWTLDELIELFQSRYTEHTRFIGFSCLFSIWCDTLESFCDWVKSRYPHIIILAGSAVLPAFRSARVDFYIQGFGEHALTALLKWLFANGSRPRFDLKKVNNRPVIRANDTYAAFPMSSLLVTYESRDFIQAHEWLTIETARGCKFQCKFCNFPVLGVKGDYSRDANDFELQLRDAYHRFGVANYIIADETFNDRTEKISKFADVVESLDFRPWFAAFIRADLMFSRPQDREQLLRMNVLGQYYGIESFNTQSARAVGKGMDSEKIKQGLISCRDYFQMHSGDLYRGTISHIVGLPHETFHSLESARQWLAQNWQGQSYTVYPLHIPVHDLSNPSEFSLDFERYGYQSLPVEVTTSLETARVKGNGIDSMLWRNANMDIFQAFEQADRWVEQKYQLDFRPSGFQIAQRCRNHPDLAHRLRVTNREFDSMRDHDISSYVRSKIDWCN
jgi:hypothetical protein